MTKLEAKKSLGQNFLINPGIIAKIIEAAQLTAEDTVLEVGPGTGNLTRALVETGARIIAVEKDHRAIEDLSAEFSAAQIEIIEGDVLEFKPERHGLEEGEYKIVANLPYYITSHFLRTVFEDWPHPSLMVLTVQKEVAQRMTAKAPDMNLLALSVQYYAEPSIITHISPGSFRPMPNVDSSVIKIIPKDHYPLTAEEEDRMFACAKAAFAGKRKQLLNTLSEALEKSKPDIEATLKNLSIDPQARPETLDIRDWIKLAKAV